VADDLTDWLYSMMPLAAVLDIQAVALAPDEVRLSLEWDHRLCNGDGVLHGGTLMSLADAAGAACAFGNLPPGAGTATIESKTNFFAAVRSGTVTATCRPLHVGSRTIVVETEVHRDDGRLAAKTIQTQAVLLRSG
jgi:1,4-dihydroxy-2-naphthoyl-CoA hydrolase